MNSSDHQSDHFVRFLAVDLEGKILEVTADNYRDCPLPGERPEAYALLRQFMANELGCAQTTGGSPKHIDYMQRHDLVDYCRVSEKGHFKWLPKGLLIRKLLLDYAEELAYQWGAFAMRNPVIIRGGQNAIGELMGEFHERDYRVDGGRGVCFLRYASDPLAFPFMQKEWIPYVAVIGEREAASGRITVRVRRSDGTWDVSVGDLADSIQAITGDMPFRRLSLPIV